MPHLCYTREEYEALSAELERQKAVWNLETREGERAILQLWRLLGAKNQAQALTELKRLVAADKERSKS